MVAGLIGHLHPMHAGKRVYVVCVCVCVYDEEDVSERERVKEKRVCNSIQPHHTITGSLGLIITPSFNENQLIVQGD